MVTRGEGCWEGIVKDLGIDMYTLLYFKWITNKDLLYSTENSAQCYVAAWMEASLGENGDMCIYAEFLCSTPETITTSLIGFTPI